MKNCPTCGKRNWEDALDCHSCGASLHDMEYQDCLFEYYRKCAAEGSDALAKIMLTESANLGSKDAAKEMRKLGLEIRPLIRYERKIVKSLRKEIYEYSGVDINNPKPNKKKEQDDISKYLPKKTSDDYAIDILTYGGLGLGCVFTLFVLVAGFFTVTGIKPPWYTPPTPEQIEKNLYLEWKELKDSRDYWYRAAENRYNNKGEVGGHFEEYLRKQRAEDAAWDRYQNYKNKRQSGEIE